MTEYTKEEEAIIWDIVWNEIKRIEKTSVVPSRFDEVKKELEILRSIEHKSERNMQITPMDV